MKKPLLLLIVLNLLYSNNINSQIIIKPWDKIGTKRTGSFNIASINNKYGLVDDNNKIYLPFEYDSIKYNTNINENFFFIYKNGKIGFAAQIGKYDTITKKDRYIISQSEAKFDSIQLEFLFIRGYNNSSVTIYFVDGSLLFPPNNICSKIYRVQLKRTPFEETSKAYNRNRNMAFKIYSPTKRKFVKQLKYKATDRSLVFFYCNKYYIFTQQKNPYDNLPTTFTEIKYSKYFRNYIKKNKDRCFIEY